MRAALWLIGLFGIAAAVALFAGHNQGTVTLFWPPYRIDLSLNFALLLLAALFATLHLALRALALLTDLPRQAQRWRLQQKERAMHGLLLDALSHQLAGRFLRARRAAETALEQEGILDAAAGAAPPHALQVRAMAHLIAAESAQSLQDVAARDQHLGAALAEATPRPGLRVQQTQEVREGVQLRAARWALEDRDAQRALEWLEQLPVGAQRRTLALRLRLQAARLAGRTTHALETARLLAKHRAFSAAAAASIVRGLATEQLNQAHDAAQLQAAWDAMEPAERTQPDVALHAALRLASLGGEPARVRDWLQPVWERALAAPEQLGAAQWLRLVQALEAGMHGLDAGWLARIEAAQQARPRDARLQYVAGIACRERQLWGKAQVLLGQAAAQLDDALLRRRAWAGVAELAEQRGDTAAAAQAWKQAARA